MAQLHLTIYARATPLGQREQARKSFRLWHGMSQVLNLVILAGLLTYFLEVTTPVNAPRIFSLNKCKG